MAEFGRLVVVLAPGPGNTREFRVQTATTDLFGSRTVQRCDPLGPGGPITDVYQSTAGFFRVWLDPSFPISSSVFQVLLLLFTFRYPSANQEILPLVRHCPYRKNRLPFPLQTGPIRSFLIMNMIVNGISMSFALASWVI